MRAFGFLLRGYSYLFHLVLCLFLLGIAVIATGSRQTLTLGGLLPFDDSNMILGIYVLTIIGLLSTILALFGIFKYAFPVWAAIVLYRMVKGFIFSNYTFGNAHAFVGSLWLIFGAIGAFFGALWVLKPRRGRL